MKNIPRCYDDAREKEFVDIVKIKSEKAPHAFARGEREREKASENFQVQNITGAKF